MFLQVAFYTFTLWLGVYLIARDLNSARLRWAGLGLVAYGLAIGLDLLALQAGGTTKDVLLRLHWTAMLFPPVFWTGAVLGLIPEEDKRKHRLNKIWQRVLIPFALIAGLFFVFGWGVWADESPELTGYLIFGVVSLLPLIALLFLLPNLRKSESTRRAFGLVIIATIFFALGAGMVFLGSNLIPHTWVVLGIGMDIVLLGLAVVYFDAFEQGEALGNDFIRSLAISTLILLVFGGQVIFVISISTGPTLAMLALLLAILAAAILVAGFAGEIQRLLDNLVFARLPRLRAERRELFGMARALPKATQDPDPAEMNDESFYKATRRALSHFNTLPKLAVNPLTALPEVTRQLQSRGAPDNTLERAQELRILLADSIERLKPDPDETFGTTDAWRYYNALYFPYVAGLRPYSRRADHDRSDPVIRAALDWFQVQVPERTLYHWQTEGAQLIAQDLREMMGD
jgi:hypothetical protein